MAFMTSFVVLLNNREYTFYITLSFASCYKPLNYSALPRDITDGIPLLLCDITIHFICISLTFAKYLKLKCQLSLAIYLYT